jgi:ferredoxin
MSKKIKFAYCKTCKQEVEKSSRKPLETMQKLVWGIAIVGTIGIAAIAYGVYLSNRPKVYCPTCFSKLEYSDKPFEKPKKKREEMTPKERVLDKAGIMEEPEEKPVPTKKPTARKKEKKEKKGDKELTCPYCGETLDEEYATCPFCQVPLKT